MPRDIAWKWRNEPRATWPEPMRKRFARIERRAPDLAEAVLEGRMSFRQAQFLAQQVSKKRLEKEKEAAR